jgi:hypothetical protein
MRGHTEAREDGGPRPVTAGGQQWPETGGSGRRRTTSCGRCEQGSKVGHQQVDPVDTVTGGDSLLGFNFKFKRIQFWFKLFQTLISPKETFLSLNF